jgi:hypothetical protein
MANKNFKVRQGLEAPLIAADDGTTAITISNSTGNIALVGTLDVQGGTITESTGALSITTGAGNGSITLTPDGSGTVIVSSDLAVNGATSADITTTTTTASVFNTTATTVNAFGAATTTNIGTKTGSSIVNGTNRFTSPTIYGFSGGATTPSRGVMISNGNAGSAASARNSLVVRTYPVTGSARGNIIFESSRGTETTPTAIQNNDLIGELVATGYATNGFISDYVTSVPGQAFFTVTENWANTGGPYPTAGTITNAGMGYILGLQPTATTLAAGNVGRVNVLNINPQTFTTRSDSYSFAKGKTNSTQMAALADDGSGKTTFSVRKPDSTSANEYALINFDTQRSSGGTYTPTQSGDTFGQFKFNGNALSGASPGGTTGPGVAITAQARETWTTIAQGSAVTFGANKIGSISNSNVINASPDALILSSDIITLENSSGTDYAVLNSTAATFTVPVTTEITSATVLEGTTYTPAATVDNNISVQLNVNGGGTTVFDLASLTGNSRGASYNILVYNNTGSGAAIQVKNTRINSNNLMTHTITTGSPRIMINAYVVGDYATADHLVVA